VTFYLRNRPYSAISSASRAISNTGTVSILICTRLRPAERSRPSDLDLHESLLWCHWGRQSACPSCHNRAARIGGTDRGRPYLAVGPERAGWPTAPPSLTTRTSQRGCYPTGP